MILDGFFEKIGYVKKEEFTESENEKKKWRNAFNRAALERDDAIDYAEQKKRELIEIKKENEKLKERVLSLKKDYSDEVLKRYEISRLLNGIQKAEAE